MRKHKVCGASWTLKECHQTKLRQYITRDLRREKVVFRSSTEHRLQAHVLATTVSSLTTDGNGTAPCSHFRSRDMHPVSTLKKQRECSKLQASLAPASSSFAHLHSPKKIQVFIVNNGL